jgi:hypothetical protein
MDLINEFAYILSKNTPNDFDTALPVNSKVRTLYELVTSGKAKNDKEAAKIIYDSSKVDKKYLMLKRNLVQKLSDLVYLQSYEETDDENYMTIHFQVEKELLIAEKLLLQNVYHNPTKIISKVEQTAEKYFFIDIQVMAARKFRSVFALKGFPKETESYDEKVKQLVKYQNYYNASRGMWEKIYSKTKYTVAKTDKIINEAAGYIKKIEQWLKKYNSPFIKGYLFQIQILYYHQQNQHENIWLTIQEIIDLVTEYPFIDNKAMRLDLNYYMARYFRDIKHIDKAEQHTQACLNLSDYRAFNRFLIQELNFDLQIKKENYTEALKVLNEIKSTPQYQFLDPYDQSAWTLREGFLFIALKVENDHKLIINIPILGQEKALSNFLVATKKSIKGKYGYNIMLLLVRVLLFKIFDQQEIDNEGNNLLIYYHRYLKEINSQRTVAFFRHLGKSAAQGFDIEEMEIRKTKFHNRLQEINCPYYDAYEIIPYERFWDMVMELAK